VQTIAPTTAFTSMRLLQPEETPRSRSGRDVNATSREPVNIFSRQPNEPVTTVDPSVLRSMYTTDAYSPAAMNQNKLGILGHSNEYPSAVDLLHFMVEFRPDAVPIERAAFPTIDCVRSRGLIQPILTM
jgi:hypothetical protein